MRFRIFLQVNESQAERKVIPINYQYYMSAAIYKILNEGNPEFSAWLHSQGYADGAKQFKLFTFSKLSIPQRRIDIDSIKILSREVSFDISFFPHPAIDGFITGIFKRQELSIGNRDRNVSFVVKSIEKLPTPLFDEKNVYRTLTPVVASLKKEGSRTATYLNPQDAEFKDIFIRNLIEKLKAWNHNSMQSTTPLKDISTEFRCISEIKRKGEVIKQGSAEESKIIGYLFDFVLTAPVEFHEIGYAAGFGEKNSMGFGLVEKIG